MTAPPTGTRHEPVPGRWFGPPERPLMGWWHAAGRQQGVVVLPAVGYGYWTGHRTLRVLAEALAARGVSVLRVDYDGTGDSAGTLAEPDRWAALQDSARHAVQELRDAGVQQVQLVGLGMGATVALTVAAQLDVAGVVAWDPVVQGRRWRRELKLLGLAVPDVDGPLHDVLHGALVHAGTVFTAQTVADVGAVDLRRLPAAPAPRVLVLSRPERPEAELVEHLGALGVDVTHLTEPGTELALDVPTEDAVVPEHLVEALVDWAADPTLAGVPADDWLAGRGRTDVVLDWDGGQVHEQVRVLGERRLTGVLGRPVASEGAAGGAAGAAGGAAGDHPLVLFVNSGSEHHVGPGRAWVEYSRWLNLHGYPTLRLDFTGWGESPDGGLAPGRPYDAHGVDDLRDVVPALRAAGWPSVVVVGVCAGAWIAMDAARQLPLAGLVALNPQLYWQRGDPVIALMKDTRIARTPQRLREERLARWHVWSVLDAVGVRHPAARWLARLRRQKVPVLMLFAEGDDGIEHLRTRLSRALRRERRHGVVRTAELAGIDHAMHRTWLRGQVTDALLAFLRALPRYGGPA